jgi:hypothetical protein
MNRKTLKKFQSSALGSIKDLDKLMAETIAIMENRLKQHNLAVRAEELLKKWKRKR